MPDSALRSKKFVTLLHKFQIEKFAFLCDFSIGILPAIIVDIRVIYVFAADYSYIYYFVFSLDL